MTKGETNSAVPSRAAWRGASLTTFEQWRKEAVRRFLISRPLRRLFRMTAAVKSLPYRSCLKEVRYYVMFVGYERSGHSLVASILDAHPHIVISNELDAFRLLREGFGRRSLGYLILDASRRFTDQGREWTGYSYLVPNQWNGRWRRIRVLGDKHGGLCTRHISRDPSLVSAMARTMNARIKVVHAIRNPYDNITTMGRKAGIALPQAVDRYIDLSRRVDMIRRHIAPEDWFDIRNEDLIRDPALKIRQLVEFLGEEASPDYLNDAAGILLDQPRKTRSEAEWSPDLVARVDALIGATDCLQGYRFAGS